MNHNENSFASGIRPPSQIPTPGKLFELSAAATNARSTAMPPPGNSLKRKTLVDRAGETSRPAPAPPSSRPINGYVKATSIAGIPRETSLSSSVSSSRPSSTSIRNASNGSYSSSVGYGSRTPSAHSYRPQSAMSQSRTQKPISTLSRPATSLEVHEEEPEAARKRKGMPPFSLNPLKFAQDIRAPKVRRNHDTPLKRTFSKESRPYGVTYLREGSLKRDVSLSTKMSSLNLNGNPMSPSHKANVGVSRSPPHVRSVPNADPDVPLTPSHIPKLAPLVALHAEPPSPRRSPQKTLKPMPRFLSKDSNEYVAWEESINADMTSFKENLKTMDGTRTENQILKSENKILRAENDCLKDENHNLSDDSKRLKESTTLYKIRITELEAMRTQLASNNSIMQIELDALKVRLATASETLEDSKRYQNIRLDDMQRQNRRELEGISREADRERRQLGREHDETVAELRRDLENALEDERVRHQKEVQALSDEGATTQQEKEQEFARQMEAFRKLEDQLQICQTDFNQEREASTGLRTKVKELTSQIGGLDTSVQRLEGHIHFLESDNKSQSQAFADLEARMQAALKCAAEANDKLVKEETLRRKLHNQVQELKGNIRVFCRVRPLLESDSIDPAKISYPDEEADSREIEILGGEEKSSLGKITTRKHPFSFDRIFGPRSGNQDVFGEISQLVQSALDGYNVCIFCYGQTGSGKTYTMSASDGMIPLAVSQIYDAAKSLEEKGWKYRMEGSFIEVYNEVLNDLLGKADEIDKRKHDIKHDAGRTTITDVTVMDLDSPGKVESILQRASKNRSVASTKSNERSSRSHSVFILKLIGANSITGEKSEGTLNLVDLAGSERVSQSGVTGDRLKETQSINKSLSCLGDVIGALGQSKEGSHIPYRNSKLTYLLQNSLGGNSKTLMFVMVSPLQTHLNETLTSLKFATKVHNTHIGTAKKQTKI